MRLNRLARRDCVSFAPGFSSSSISSYFRLLETWPLTPVALRLAKDAVDSFKNVVASDGPSNSPQRRWLCVPGLEGTNPLEPQTPHAMVCSASLSTIPASCGILHLGLLRLIWSHSTFPPFQGLQVPSRARTRWKNSQMWGSSTRCLR